MRNSVPSNLQMQWWPRSTSLLCRFSVVVLRFAAAWDAVRQRLGSGGSKRGVRSALDQGGGQRFLAFDYPL